MIEFGLNRSLTQRGRDLRRARAHGLDNVRMLSDPPARDDALEREAFAASLATRLRNINRTWEGPFILHLYGPWGSGKTSLLNLLAHQLGQGTSEPDRWVVVTFNAWQHQRVGSPWWWLLNAAYTESLRQVPPARALTLRMLEQTWRVTVGWAPSVLALVLLALVLWLVFALGLPGGTTPFSNLKDLGQSIVAILGVVGTVLVATQGLGRRLLTGSTQPAGTILFARDPMQALSSHFNYLVSQVGRPLAIFIDDVDRCQPAYVVELLEGIVTLFGGANVTYVIAGDRAWLRAAFEETYKLYVGRMDEPGRPLGYLFLDQILQLAAPVPYLTPEVQQGYWERLIAVERRGAKRPSGSLGEQARVLASDVQTGTDAQAILRSTADLDLRRAAAGQMIQQLARPDAEQRTEHLLRPFAHLLEPNPRAMKRLVNAFGVHEAIDLLAGGYADPKQLALWTILELRWPLLAECLATYPERVGQFRTQASPDQPQPPGPPDNLKLLQESDAVRGVLNVDGNGTELDADAIRACVGRTGVAARAPDAPNATDVKTW